jgi:hypothetical protein
VEAWFKDENGQLLATVVQDKMYPAPGVDRERLAFEMFKMMVVLMTPGQPTVTWGTAWMSGNMGTPTSPGS